MELHELFPQIQPNEPQNTVQEQIYRIPVHKIRPNPSQPRMEFDEEALVKLADSIKQYGILQPLTVRALPTPDADGAVYELVAGERRLRAAKLLALEQVPCILIRVDGKRSAELAIIENIQRENLNMFEEATAIASLIDLYSLTQDEIAKRLSTSQSYVANKLRILRLSAFERENILRHNLTERHARALLRIDDPEQRAQILREIISRGYNVAATEEYIERQLAIKEQKGSEKERKSRQMKLILKDIRLFHNTINHAIDTVRNAGVNIISSKSESEEAVEWTIRIQKKPIAVEKEESVSQDVAPLLQIDLQAPSEPTAEPLATAEPPQIGYLPVDLVDTQPLSPKAISFIEEEADRILERFSLA